MKVIFLDIDGVLNHELWFKNWIKYKKENINTIEKERRWFDPRCIELLNRLVRETNAKIVISSSWRLGSSLEDLTNKLKSVGLVADIIAKTPKLEFERVGKTVPRGNEIAYWMEFTKNKIESYVILDDDSDMLLSQANNFIKIDTYCGITHNTVNKAKLILNQKNK